MSVSALGIYGIGCLVDHDVGSLEATELLDPTPGDTELVMVEHHVRRQGAALPGAARGSRAG